MRRINLASACRYLRLSRVPSARVDAQWLLKRSPGEMLRANLIRRGREKEPLAYILGSTDFHGMHDFVVKAPVLIPRPETEQLVQLVIEHVTRQPRLFIDMCCGSGAIAISLLRAWPHSIAVAVDCSEAACQLTRLNADKFGVSNRLNIVQCSAETFNISRVGPVDLLVSNPPYIPTDRIATLDRQIVDWEDHRALDGGSDGLDLVRRILAKYSEIPEMWFELDCGQSKVLGEEQGGKQLQSYPDWFGCDDRFVRFIHS